MEEPEFREFTRDDLEAVLDELEETDPGIRARVEELAQQIRDQGLDEPTYLAVSLMFRQSPGHNWDSFSEMLEEWLPECDEFLEDGHCSCGMISFGGTEGTEEQCWKHLGLHESVTWVDTEDLKLVLGTIDPFKLVTSVREAFDRLIDEATWWDRIDEALEDLPTDIDYSENEAYQLEVEKRNRDEW